MKIDPRHLIPIKRGASFFNPEPNVEIFLDKPGTVKVSGKIVSHGTYHKFTLPSKNFEIEASEPGHLAGMVSSTVKNREDVLTNEDKRPSYSPETESVLLAVRQQNLKLRREKEQRRLDKIWEDLTEEEREKAEAELRKVEVEKAKERQRKEEEDALLNPKKPDEGLKGEGEAAKPDGEGGPSDGG